MFDINQVYKVDNFLTEEEIKGFHHYAEHYVWRLDGYSYDKSRLFWRKDLWLSSWGKCKQIEETFRSKIEQMFNIKVETEKLYLNGQAHGQCGSMHVDTDDIINDVNSDYITVVYYANEEWFPEYGGFTVIIDHLKNMHINYPKPNSIVIFNSRLPHIGLEPTIHCTTQRVTLAHKMKILKD